LSKWLKQQKLHFCSQVRAHKKSACSLNLQNSLVVQETFAEASEAIGFDLWQIAQSGEGLIKLKILSLYCSLRVLLYGVYG
jgi:hypothetical protein